MLGVFRIVFGVFFVLNLILWINGSSECVTVNAAGCVQDRVWCILCAESAPVDQRQQCRCAIQHSCCAACSLVWNLRPTHIRWSLLRLQEAGMSADVVVGSYVTYIQLLLHPLRMLCNAWHLSVCLSVSKFT